MSVCGQSGHTEEDSASEEVSAQATATRDIYKQKPTSKLVRVLTVLAYLLSVSLAAILLSVYYVCVWKSPELPLNETGGMSARRASYDIRHVHHAARTSFNYGGGDTAVSDHIVHSPPENLTRGFPDDSVSTEPTTDASINTTQPYTTSTEYNGTSDNMSRIKDTDSII